MTLLYQRRAPAQYTARLGSGGWCGGWGWTAEAAIEDLATAVAQTRPDGVAGAVLADRSALLRWLRRRMPEPVLDE